MSARQIPGVEAPEARERPGRGTECVFELPPFRSPPLEIWRRVPLVPVDTQMVGTKRVNDDENDRVTLDGSAACGERRSDYGEQENEQRARTAAPEMASDPL